MLVAESTPWIYSGLVHLLLLALLLDIAFRPGGDVPPPAKEVRVGVVTLAQGDDGDEGETMVEQEDPEQDAAETEAEETRDSQPVQRSPAPMAPNPDPERREPSPPTDDELALLFGLGGQPIPMEGPQDAASDPEATSLLHSLLAEQATRGQATPYGSRNAAGRTAGVRAHGGSPGSESAVEDGLAWLAAHQSPDGAWRLDSFDLRCPPDDPCRGHGYESYDIGATAMCTLAFLGAGYHHRGEGDAPGAPGHYKDVVARSVYFLRKAQLTPGQFGGRGVNMYNHSLATLALIEAYALSRDPQLKPHIRNAVAYLVDAQEPKGGWNYSPRAKAERNDSSITGWVLMALHGAEVTGFEVPAGCTRRARRFLASMTAADGRVSYADNGQLAFRDSLALVPVGLFSTLLLGGTGKDTRSLRQRALILENLPTWNGTEQLDTSLYYIYYGSLALFFNGGAAWQRWNDAVLATLLPAQRQTGHHKGSWDPIAKWAEKHGGRVYSTALSVLILEIYYKYQPSYLGKPGSFPSSGTFGFPSSRGQAGSRYPDARLRESPRRER